MTSNSPAAIRGLLLLLAAGTAAAQPRYFAGAFTGISTLSADGKTISNGDVTQFSSYKPENGPTLVAFGGRHLTDYFSVMGSYSWNRNGTLLSAGRFEDGRQTFYEQPRRVVLHTGVAEGMLYFRNRRSRVRPYLSAGFGVTRQSSNAGLAAGAANVIIGRPSLPPPRLTHTGPALRVAVGVDLFVRKGFAIRYSFSETIQHNLTSRALDPPGSRRLANFQNWFGFSYHFPAR